MLGVALLSLASIGYLVLRAPRDPEPQVLPSRAETGHRAPVPDLVPPVGGEASRQQPVDPSTTRVDAQSTVAPEEPAWRQRRLVELDVIFDQLKQVRDSDASSDELLHQFFWLTIAPIQDARGEYEEPGSGVQTSLATSSGEHVFSFRNRIYRFPRGQYPAYDEMMDRWAAVIPPPDRLPGTDAKREWIPIDPSLLAQMEALKSRAQRVIRDRQEPY